MSKKTLSPYILPFRCHTPKLLNETFVGACREVDLAALRIPLNHFIEYLRILTSRCAELNDPVLNKIMIDMTLYEESDPYSKSHNQEMIDEVNRIYNEYMKGKTN